MSGKRRSARLRKEEEKKAKARISLPKDVVPPPVAESGEAGDADKKKAVATASSGRVSRSRGGDGKTGGSSTTSAAGMKKPQSTVAKMPAAAAAAAAAAASVEETGENGDAKKNAKTGKPSGNKTDGGDGKAGLGKATSSGEKEDAPPAAAAAAALEAGNDDASKERTGEEEMPSGSGFKQDRGDGKTESTQATSKGSTSSKKDSDSVASSSSAGEAWLSSEGTAAASIRGTNKTEDGGDGTADSVTAKENGAIEFCNSATGKEEGKKIPPPSVAAAAAAKEAQGRKETPTTSGIQGSDGKTSGGKASSTTEASTSAKTSPPTMASSSVASGVTGDADGGKKKEGGGNMPTGGHDGNTTGTGGSKTNADSKSAGKLPSKASTTVPSGVAAAVGGAKKRERTAEAATSGGSGHTGTMAGDVDAGKMTGATSSKATSKENASKKSQPPSVASVIGQTEGGSEEGGMPPIGHDDENTTDSIKGGGEGGGKANEGSKLNAKTSPSPSVGAEPSVETAGAAVAASIGVGHDEKGSTNGDVRTSASDGTSKPSGSRVQPGSRPPRDRRNLPSAKPNTKAAGASKYPTMVAISGDGKSKGTAGSINDSRNEDSESKKSGDDEEKLSASGIANRPATTTAPTDRQSTSFSDHGQASGAAIPATALDSKRPTVDGETSTAASSSGVKSSFKTPIDSRDELIAAASKDFTIANNDSDTPAVPMTPLGKAQETTNPKDTTTDSTIGKNGESPVAKAIASIEARTAGSSKTAVATSPAVSSFAVTSSARNIAKTPSKFSHRSSKGAAEAMSGESMPSVSAAVASIEKKSSSPDAKTSTTTTTVKRNGMASNNSADAAGQSALFSNSDLTIQTIDGLQQDIREKFKVIRILCLEITKKDAAYQEKDGENKMLRQQLREETEAREKLQIESQQKSEEIDRLCSSHQDYVAQMEQADLSVDELLRMELGRLRIQAEQDKTHIEMLKNFAKVNDAPRETTKSQLASASPELKKKLLKARLRAEPHSLARSQSESTGIDVMARHVAASQIVELKKKVASLQTQLSHAVDLLAANKTLKTKESVQRYALELTHHFENGCDGGSILSMLWRIGAIVNKPTQSTNQALQQGFSLGMQRACFVEQHYLRCLYRCIELFGFVLACAPPNVAKIQATTFYSQLRDTVDFVDGNEYKMASFLQLENILNGPAASVAPGDALDVGSQVSSASGDVNFVAPDYGNLPAASVAEISDAESQSSNTSIALTNAMGVTSMQVDPEILELRVLDYSKSDYSLKIGPHLPAQLLRMATNEKFPVIEMVDPDGFRVRDGAEMAHLVAQYGGYNKARYKKWVDELKGYGFHAVADDEEGVHYRHSKNWFIPEHPELCTLMQHEFGRVSRHSGKKAYDTWVGALKSGDVFPEQIRDHIIPPSRYLERLEKERGGQDFP